MTAHRVVDQHPLERFDVFLKRLAFGGHHRLHFLVIRHQQRRDGTGATTGLQHSAFRDVDQLTHVARPRGLQQLRGLLRRYFGGITAVFVRKLIPQTREQGQNVFAPLTQRWHSDAQCGQTVQQIRTQRVFAGATRFLHVANADDAGFCRRALLVDHAQQTRLQALADRLDVFKNQRATAGLFDRRQLRVLRQHRAKQTFAKRLFFQSGTADQHEFLTSAAANSVQRVRHQCFTSAGFAFDQNVAISLPQIQNIFAQALHHR